MRLTAELQQSDMPLHGPHDVIGPRHSVLVGRSTELAALQRAAAEARAGRGGLVLVHGEAGVGKSRLCRELAASQTAALLLRGQAYLGDDVVAQAILVDALRAARRDASSPVWAAAERRATTLGAIVPELLSAGAPVRLDDEPTIFEAVLDVVDDAAAGRPTLWIAEDVQWADAASWRFLHYASRRAPSMRLLLLATYRDDEALPNDAAWTRLTLAAPREGARSLALQRLSPPDTERLVRDALAATLDADEVERIVRRSGGTPLLVEELVATRDALPVGGGDVPDIVRSTARERMRRAGADAMDLLDLAAVMGHDADLGLLVDLRPDDAAAVDSLVRAGLLRPAPDAVGGTVEFRHPLLREAVYEEMSWERRRRLHAEAAATLTRHRSAQSVERVARHWELAGRPDDALAALRAAVDGARSQANLRRAIGLQLLALQLCDRHDRLGHQRAAIVDPLLDDLFRAGQWDELAPLAGHAWSAAVPGSPRRLLLTGYMAQAQWMLGMPLLDTQRLVASELATLQADTGTEAAVLLFVASFVAYCACDLAASREYAQRSFQAARLAGDVDAACRAEGQRIWADIALGGDRDRAAQEMRKVLDWARSAGLRTREASAALQVARITMRPEDIEHAEALGRASSAWFEMGAQVHGAFRLIFAGHPAEGRAILDAVSTQVEDTSQAAWYVTVGRSFHALMTGDVGGARLAAPQLRSEAWRASPQLLPDAELAAGWLAWEEGDMAAAIASFQRCREAMVSARVEPGLSGPYFVALHVDALLRRDEAGRARELLESATDDQPGADPYTRAGFAAARFRLDPGPGTLAAATATARQEWPWLCGLVASWAAELLGDVGMAAQALDLWRQVGYAPGVARMEHLVQRAGARAVSGPRLTAREEAVADLVAEGLTNAEIAARLGISPVTVAHHVSNLLDKMGVGSRTQVAVIRAKGR